MRRAIPLQQLLMAMILLLAAPAAGAQTADTAGTAADSRPELRIVSPVRLPYVAEQDGGAAGPAAELAMELAREAGFSPTVRIMPFQRAVLALEREKAMYPALLRTPDRERKYVWIGEVHADQARFFFLADGPAFPDAEAARQASAITILRGSELQKTLATLGLGNAEPNASEIDNARLLRHRRVDAWFALDAVGRATWRELGYDPALLRASAPVDDFSFWIAASPNLPADAVARLRAAYQTMRRDGRYARIVAPLAALN